MTLSKYEEKNLTGSHQACCPQGMCDVDGVGVMDVSPPHNIFNDIDKMSNPRYWKIFL